MTAEGFTGNDGGAVDSVNGETGTVVLDAADVGADPAGTAAALDAADVGADPVGTAATAVSNHAAASDPHADRAFATTAAGTAVSTHSAATDPHADRAFTTTAVSTHAGATDPHGDRAFTSSTVSTHAGATDPHGDRAFTTTAVSTHAGATDPHADRAYADAAIAALGDLLRRPGGIAEQVATWTAIDEWLRINTPFSAGDNNPDLIRFFNGSVKVFWLNGNAEPRSNPSAINRVGQRAFEFENGSNDVFWMLSTNPTDPGLREALAAAYGTLHATMPGWIVIRETLKAKAVVADTSLSVGGQAVLATPTWVNATLGTSIVKKTGQAAAPGSSLERGMVTWRGSLQWPTGVNITAAYQLAQVTALHRPISPKSFSIRTVGSGSNISTALNLGADGWLTPEASLGTSSGTVFLPIDGLTWDLS